MDYATAFGKDEVLKAINGPMDEVVAAMKMVPADTQNWAEQEFSILRKELLDVVANVVQDQALVAEILDYARDAAKEIEAGAVRASPAIGRRSFALQEKLLAHADLVLDDTGRRTVFKTELDPIVRSYVVHKFGNRSI